MLHAFELQEGILSAIPEDDEGRVELSRAMWIDLIDPDDSERAQVERLYRQDLPDVEDVEEIEASARYYEDQDGLHVHSLFLQDIDGRPTSTTVAFILSGHRLFTLHEHSLSVFRLLRLRARREPDLAEDETSLLLGLFETKVENLADRLERVHTELERVSAQVLADEDDVDLEGAIDELTRQEDINGKIRLCLMDTQRALTFLLRRGRLNTENREWVRELLRDVDSLLPHNQFLFEKVNFLMDAAISFINIEQNQIIKIFSIAAVVFLPPTMVASIYGMNFRVMPELDWTFGYPFALMLMVLAGVAPYVYFKRKGWL
ncbi:Magnesium transport protein CorA [wastewater metagenome]|uniref:Magnesium transport protein CorA n=2 Tax=unclassified sequences TaxID=12908 RepID=A0A5B8R8U2_9ZZZZ|nr:MULTISPECIES: magnesium/cobalt transporter CorA [Arhodomonas]MCS4502849.1 magnesium/cobalt transporter CorA [Arhodomonas aquaeolei]QEA05140.1 magnesium transport protein CorA [uncultured organism]